MSSEDVKQMWYVFGRWIAAGLLIVAICIGGWYIGRGCEFARHEIICAPEQEKSA